MINKSGMTIAFFFLLTCIATTGCADKQKHTPANPPADQVTIGPAAGDTTPVQTGKKHPGLLIPQTFTGILRPDSIVAFAKTLIGIPYLYASADPRKGFDCSGFITYVFNHFKLNVPRSSVDFTHYGKDISMENAKPGDLILFTGTDSTKRIVGHMGIVESNQDGQLRFIHSTSGKGYGVVITPFGNYYQSRFVKLIRILPDEWFR